MKIALLQYCASQDKAANLARAIAMSREAIERGAKFILLPEVFNSRGDSRNKELFAGAAEKIPGPSTEIFTHLAKKFFTGVYIRESFQYPRL
jgi:predicted amidohydrolase